MKQLDLFPRSKLEWLLWSEKRKKRLDQINFFVEKKRREMARFN